MNKAFLLCLFLSLSLRAEELEWLTDYPAALQKARAENKAVLLDFTGSDWCGWCIKLKKEVFDKPAFIAFAKENLVLVEIDFPRRKKLSDAQLEANEKLAAEFRVTGYPTIHFVDKNGTRLRRSGYIPGGPAAFIADVMQIKSHPWKTPASVPAPEEPESAASPKKKPAPENKVFQTPPPKIRYENLSLKGISGTKAKRLALINNQTFAVGETANVSWGDKKVSVQCREIRDDSVVIMVDGEKEPRELKLK